MIYQLNNETHWEIEPAVMRDVVSMINERLTRGNGWEAPGDQKLVIGLSNLRSAFECELLRLADKARAAKVPATDNDDLIG